MADFRLVETWVQYSQQWEDGPGSLVNPQEDIQVSVYQTWGGVPEELGKDLLENGMEDLRSFEGDQEFSYELQVFQDGNWKTLGPVYPA